MFYLQKTNFSSILLISIILIAASLVVFFGQIISFKNIQQNIKKSLNVNDLVLFDPPRPQDSPKEIHNDVMLGYNILNQTKKYLPDNVSNELNCSNCHFNAGLDRKSISFVGISSSLREKEIIKNINECLINSENGKYLSANSNEIKALLEYYKWISTGMPDSLNLPWLHLKAIRSEHEPNADAGKTVYIQKCLVCHGDGGGGTLIAPAVWGNKSFSENSKLIDKKNMASFIYHFMPKGNPNLSKEEALNAAEFLVTQNRPGYKN